MQVVVRGLSGLVSDLVRGVVDIICLIVCLVELIEIRTRTLSVDCGYLSHNLSVVRMRLIHLLLRAPTCFVRADF